MNSAVQEPPARGDIPIVGQDAGTVEKGVDCDCRWICLCCHWHSRHFEVSEARCKHYLCGANCKYSKPSTGMQQ